MLTTVAVCDLAPGIVFIRLSPSFLHLRLVCELSYLCGILQNIAKLLYIVTKVA